MAAVELPRQTEVAWVEIVDPWDHLSSCASCLERSGWRESPGVALVNVCVLRHRYKQSSYRTVYLREVVVLDDLKMSEVLL